MAKRKNIDWRVTCTAIVALVGLEIAAMYHGINGKFFSIIIGIIAGLAGLTIKTPKILMEK